MSEMDDLEQQVGRIEESLGQPEGTDAEAFKGLRDRLDAIRERLVEKNNTLEAKDKVITRLIDENVQLRNMLQRLTRAFENRTGGYVNEEIRSLDTQIETLVELVRPKTENGEDEAPLAETTPSPGGEPKADAAVEDSDRQWFRGILGGATDSVPDAGTGAETGEKPKRNVEAYGPGPHGAPENPFAVISGKDAAAK